MGDDAEIIKEFLVESYENLDRLDQDLIALEKDPGNRETLASIFRTIHTIKGTSGFLAFNKLEAVTHVGESLLSRLRDGLLSLNPEITTALLAMVDAVRQMLNSIDGNGSEGERDDKELIATLTRLVQPGPQPNAVPVNNAIAANKGQAPEPKTQPSVAAPPLIAPAAQVQVKAAQPASPEKAPTVSEPPSSSRKKDDKQPVEAVEAADKPSEPAPVRGQSASDSTIRVDVSLLDQLMNLVGELVLARN